MIVGTLNPTHIRETYLRGVQLGAAWQGPSADAAMATLTDAITEEAQGKLGIRFARNRVRTYPDPGLVLGVDYEIEGEPLFYYRTAPGAGHIVIPLPFANIVSIERVRLFYGNPGANPPTQSLYQVPPQWILFTEKEGVLRINPTITAVTTQMQTPFGATGGFESIFYGYSYRTEIPGAWAVDYTVGYGKIPLDVARWIGLQVAINVLAQAALSPELGGGVGTKSLSMDGISQSVGYLQGDYGPLSGLIKAYKDQLECLDIRQLRLRYKGIKVAVW